MPNNSPVIFIVAHGSVVCPESVEGGIKLNSFKYCAFQTKNWTFRG